MYQLEKTFTFEAGHMLCHHDGKCRQPHGHSYTLTIHLRSETLISEGSKQNMLMDFMDVSATVKPMIEKYFDHQWLNDTLRNDSTTAEFIAKWIYDFLEPKLPALYAITLHETSTARITYSR